MTVGIRKASGPRFGVVNRSKCFPCVPTYASEITVFRFSSCSQASEECCADGMCNFRSVNVNPKPPGKDELILTRQESGTAGFKVLRVAGWTTGRQRVT